MSWLSRLLHRDSEAPTETKSGDLPKTDRDATPGNAQAEPDAASAEYDPAVHRVLISEDRQGRFYGGHGVYSVWPLDSQMPSGWTDTGFRGTKEGCNEEASRLGIAPIDIQKLYDVRRWRGATQYLMFDPGVVRWVEILDVLIGLPRQLSEASGSAGPQPSVAERLCGVLKQHQWVELKLDAGGDDGAGTPLICAYQDRYKDWTAFAVAWNESDFRLDRDVDKIYRLDELSGRRVPAVVLLTASRELRALMQEQGADRSLIPDITDEDLLPVLDAGDFRGARPVMLLVAKPTLWVEAGAAPSGA